MAHSETYAQVLTWIKNAKYIQYPDEYSAKFDKKLDNLAKTDPDNYTCSLIEIAIDDSIDSKY